MAAVEFKEAEGRHDATRWIAAATTQTIARRFIRQIAPPYVRMLMPRMDRLYKIQA